jgi:hypothetical protein
MLPIWIDLGLTFLQLFTLLLLSLALCNVKPSHRINVQIVLLSSLINVIAFHNTESFIIKIIFTYGVMIIGVILLYTLEPLMGTVMIMLGLVSYIAVEYGILLIVFSVADMSLLSYRSNVKANIGVITLESVITLATGMALWANSYFLIDFSKKEESL